MKSTSKPRNHDNLPENGGRNSRSILILVVLAIGGLYFLYHRHRTKAALSSKAPESPKTSAQTLTDVPNEKRNGKDFAKDLMANRKSIHAESVLGFKTFPLKKTGSKLALPIQFMSKPLWCQGGDLDSIRNDVSKTSSPEVLILLESMKSKESKKKIYVSYDKLLSGFKETFEIDGDRSGSLSLSVCLDKAKTGSCKDIKQLYYFQHLLVTKDSIQVYRSDVIDPQYRKKLRDFLKDNSSAQDLEKALELSGKTRSAPSTIENGFLTVNLPHNDPRCVSGG